MPAGRLVLVSGLPGSGKTTTSIRVEHALRAVRLCPDEWMAQLHIDLWDTARRSAIERVQWSLAKRLLACGATVVIEWGLWTRRERDELRDQARSVGAAVELRFLDAPVDLLWERIRERGVEQWRGSAPITRDHLDQWDAELERPDAAEHALYDPPLTP